MATAREYAERRAKECFADEAASLDRAGFYSTLTGFGSDMKDALDAAKRHHAAGLEWQEQADALAKLPQPSPIPGVIAVDWQEHGPAKKQEPVTIKVQYVSGEMLGGNEVRVHLDRVFSGMRRETMTIPARPVIHAASPQTPGVPACGDATARHISCDNDWERSTCRACEEAIRALSPMPVPKHRMYRVTNEQTWEEP